MANHQRITQNDKPSDLHPKSQSIQMSCKTTKLMHKITNHPNNTQNDKAPKTTQNDKAPK